MIPRRPSSALVRVVALVFTFVGGGPGFWPVGAVLADGRVITHPRPESESDLRSVYPVRLLELGLTKSGMAFRLQSTSTVMLQARALLELASNRKNVDIVWSMTSLDRESDLRAVRIPIYKGLIGWRIFLIHADDRAVFRNLAGLEQLKTLLAGQGHDWPDTDILRHNGLLVRGSSNYQSLFRMLDLKRLAYFPRSVLEIWSEFEQHRSLSLTIEDSLVLHYPAAAYFFVHPEDHALAEQLERGLNTALADGSFDALFSWHYAQFLQQARLHERRVFELENPLLPPDTPLGRKVLWFDPHLHGAAPETHPDP